jgi:Flp pilus assembly CpaE family ATPase
VLNHCYHRSEVKVKDLERALGFDIVQEIEYAPNQVTTSLNRGVPLIDGYRDSGAARSIAQLAQKIVDNSLARASLDEEDQAMGTADKRKRGLFSQRRSATP